MANLRVSGSVSLVLVLSLAAACGSDGSGGGGAGSGGAASGGVGAAGTSGSSGAGGAGGAAGGAGGAGGAAGAGGGAAGSSSGGSAGADAGPDASTGGVGGADAGADADAGPPVVTQQSGSCASPVSVTVVGGVAKIAGDTSKLSDEHPTLKCKHSGAGNLSGALSGPQAYYELHGTPGAWYRFALTKAQTSQLVYLFESTSCTAAAIQTDCQSGGVTGNAGTAFFTHPGIVYQKLPASGLIRFAVDGPAGTQGAFTLDVDEIATPDHGSCATAKPLTLTGGSVKVLGNVVPETMPDDPANVFCEASYQKGAQAYYTFDAKPGHGYRFTIDSAPVCGALNAYLFSGACTQPAITADCQSGGASGDAENTIWNGTQRVFEYRPVAPGKQMLVIDSSTPDDFGGFGLQIDELPEPANDDCGNATPISLVGNSAIINGQTTLAESQFPGLICGGQGAGGKDVFYELPVTAGDVYWLKLTPQFDGATLYFFDKASCAAGAGAVGADCSSGGLSGNAVGSATYGTPARLHLVATKTGSFVIGVGSGQLGQSGKFNLTVTKLTTPLVSAPFSYDFETSGAGFGGTGDWEWGKLSFKATTCVVLSPPTSSPGHTGMWGTVLNDCFNSLGNIEGWDKCTSTVPENDSILSFAAVIPASWSKATLHWRDWVGFATSGYGTFREIWVNSKPASSPCQGSQGDWTERTLDLSQWIGKPVVVGFHFMGVKPVGPGAGWYVDEMSLSEN